MPENTREYYVLALNDVPTKYRQTRKRILTEGVCSSWFNSRTSPFFFTFVSRRVTTEGTPEIVGRCRGRAVCFFVIKLVRLFGTRVFNRWSTERFWEPVACVTRRKDGDSVIRELFRRRLNVVRFRISFPHFLVRKIENNFQRSNKKKKPGVVIDVSTIYFNAFDGRIGK